MGLFLVTKVATERLFLFQRKEAQALRKLENYTPTRFMAADSTYSKQMADYAVNSAIQREHGPVSPLSSSIGRNKLLEISSEL